MSSDTCADGEPFLMSDGIGVGYGARPFADGNDAVYLLAQENYPAEFVESAAMTRAISSSCRSAARARCMAAPWSASSRDEHRAGAARAGVTSAVGLLVSNLRTEFSRTGLTGARL